MAHRHGRGWILLMVAVLGLTGARALAQDETSVVGALSDASGGVGAEVLACMAGIDTRRNFGPVPDEDCAPDVAVACDEQPLPPIAVDTHNYPENCEWVSAQSPDKATRATCPSGSFVFSGGCMAGSALAATSPWEQDSDNLPDPHEAFFFVNEPNGWMCVRSGDSSTMTVAVALCCRQSPDIESFPETLQDCGWSRSTVKSSFGGVFSWCPEWTVPITSGLYQPDFSNKQPRPFPVLAPASWLFGTIDGFVAGEPLADDHPYIHGEPPEDDTLASNYVAQAALTKGTGKHHEWTGGTDEYQEVLTLCCGVPLPPPPWIALASSMSTEPGGANAPVPGPGFPDRLTQCEYERALIAPVQDPLVPQQYVAKLPCENGAHVVSGGCYAQFLHGKTNADLAGSHPYENGQYTDLPDSGDRQAEVSGENGWVCRLNRAPQPFLGYPGEEFADVAVEAICCY